MGLVFTPSGVQVLLLCGLKICFNNWKKLDIVLIFYVNIFTLLIMLISFFFNLHYLWHLHINLFNLFFPWTTSSNYLRLKAPSLVSFRHTSSFGTSKTKTLKYSKFSLCPSSVYTSSMKLSSNSLQDHFWFAQFHEQWFLLWIGNSARIENEMFNL